MQRRWVVVEKGHKAVVSQHASREAAARASRTLTEVCGVEYRVIERRAPRHVAVPWTCTAPKTTQLTARDSDTRDNASSAAREPPPSEIDRARVKPNKV